MIDFHSSRTYFSSRDSFPLKIQCALLDLRPEKSLATRMEPFPFARFTFPSRILFRFAILRLLSRLAIFFTLISQASAQTSTQQ